MKKILIFIAVWMLCQLIFCSNRNFSITSGIDRVAIDTIWKGSQYSIVNYGYYNNTGLNKRVVYYIFLNGKKKVHSISNFSKGKETSILFYDDDERLLWKADSIGPNTRFKGYALKHGYSKDLPFQCRCTTYDTDGNVKSIEWMVYDEDIESDSSLEIVP